MQQPSLIPLVCASYDLSSHASELKRRQSEQVGIGLPHGSCLYGVCQVKVFRKESYPEDCVSQGNAIARKSPSRENTDARKTSLLGRISLPIETLLQVVIPRQSTQANDCLPRTKLSKALQLPCHDVPREPKHVRQACAQQSKSGETKRAADWPHTRA